ncbi:MAG TPA: GGDEF domain-containing protein [Spirochaetia bacterium]|nr:GGDEF domain-containing protein [Spirochaetia bacterium]
MNIFLYVKPLSISYKFYNNWSLYVDMLFISAIVVIRGGIRSDFFLGYILILQYLAYLPENKPIAVTLIIMCILYAISCILGTGSLKIDWGRYIIRISFLIASYYILDYSIKQIKTADAIQKYAFDKVFRDSLTGTYNRNMYEEVFIGQTATHSGQCCVMLDIDNMKSINDTYGHQTGDKVLKKLGTIILSNIRESDICIRYGGDEFFIHFNHISEKLCSLLMQRIVSKIAVESINLDTAIIHFSISYGIYAIPPGTTYEEAVAQADKRLYISKNMSKICVK